MGRPKSANGKRHSIQMAFIAGIDEVILSDYEIGDELVKFLSRQLPASRSCTLVLQVPVAPL